ncbi:MAG: hypothetical protein IJ011_01085 [Clostridia bacterium]|nr:hypothetical protein [Clostridia bacterium]
MLKKIISLVLMVCTVFCFSSCGFIIRILKADNIEETKEAEETVETYETDKAGTSYKDIVCVESKNFGKVKFSVGSDNTVISTALPKDVVLSKRADGGLDIVRDGINIGLISTEANEYVGKHNCEFSDDFIYYGISAVHTINRLSEGEYVHYYTIDYTADKGVQRTVYITVNYVEFDEFAANKVLYNIACMEASSIPDMASYKLSDSVIRRGANIMILGNSFISSSSIGTILNDMCRYRHNVDAISIGYATVSRTYSVDDATLSALRSGEVDALFMCGFYSYSDADALEVIVEACRYSNTKLFIFPAHNESESAIDTAVSKYDYSVFLDWKGEVDMLIDEGVDYNDFCINDTHKHSTSLAGYVGAHMIYRTLFGEIPPELTGNSAIDQSYVEQKLGDYVDTGIIEVISEDEINRIN